MYALLQDTLRLLRAEMPWLFPLCFGLFGACIGSFLNVVIYRSPRGLSLSDPARSFCPRCEKEIPWYLNIPLLSWLVLRGKCASCGGRIPFRYWLVEAATAGLFVAATMYYAQEDLLAQLLLCLWLAMAVVMISIDAERMEVLPKHALLAAAAGLGFAAFAPWLIDGTALEASDGLMWSAAGAIAGFILMKAVAFAGKLLFGHRRIRHEEPAPWNLRQCDDGEDIILTLPDGPMSWAELFAEPGNRLILEDATLFIDGAEVPGGTLTFTADSVSTETGTAYPLEDCDTLSGTFRGLRTSRAAMGSGDAWIMLAIGALCGWEGVVFTLIAASLLGIVGGLATKVGRGNPMPFGPYLLAAAILWVFGGSSLWNWYTGYFT